MNTCTYQLQTFSYQPKNKILTIEDRKLLFRKRLLKWAQTNDLSYKQYPKWLRKEFYEYWTEFANDNGRKMRFEMERTWNTGRRLATAKKTIYSKDPRWKEVVEYTKPKRANQDYELKPIDYSSARRSGQDQSIGQIMNAGSRLKNNWK
jgi:hypothetical protein